MAALEAALRDKEAKNADLAARCKELSANLTIEQENSSKLKSERDTLERDQGTQRRHRDLEAIVKSKLGRCLPEAEGIGD